MEEGLGSLSLYSIYKKDNSILLIRIKSKKKRRLKGNGSVYDYYGCNGTEISTREEDD